MKKTTRQRWRSLTKKKTTNIRSDRKYGKIAKRNHIFLQKTQSLLWSGVILRHTTHLQPTRSHQLDLQQQ